MSKWISVAEELPDNDRHILVSFENSPRVAIGRYVVDENTESGVFENESCYPFVKFDLFVSAWMELPERYEVKLCDTCIYGDKYELEKPCVLYSDGCKLYEEKIMDDMTRSRAISELNQIYGILSPDKQRALDIAINSLRIDEQYDLMYEQAEPTGHCKDCKYFEYDSVAKVDGMPLIVAHEICTKWGDGCKSKEDGYCFLFEPKAESEE